MKFLFNKKNLVTTILILLSCFMFAKEFNFCAQYQLTSGTVNEYKLQNGIPVFMNTEVPNQVNAIYIIVEGGTLSLTPEYSGLESSLFKMMTYGSKKYDYNLIQTLDYKYQSSMGHYSLYSGSVFYLSCINYYLDNMLDVFVDCFLNPALNQKEFDLMKNELVQKIVKSKNDPETILFDYIHNQVYKNSPLLTSSSVKEESLNNITIENLLNHHQKILDASRIKIVAVGKFNVNEFLSKLDNSFGKIENKNFKTIPQEKIKLNIGKEKIILTHKDAAGSEIAVRVFESPSVLSDDYVCAQIVSDIFSSTMFNIIREKYGACYTPASQIDSSFNPVGIDYGLRVSDLENFEKYFAECENLMLEGKVISSVDGKNVIYDSIENCLAGYKNSYLTKKYSSQSTSSGIASRMAASILQFGDLTSADKIPSKALNVSSSDILRVFKTYWLSPKNQWFIMKGM